MKIKTKSYFSQALMALLSLLFLITSVNLLQNIGGGTTDLSENSIAQAPTNTTYWIDETTQTALSVDFDNYSLTKDTSAIDTTYLIQSEKDLAFLSWTIYNDKVYGGSSNKVTSGSNDYFYSDVCFKQTKNLDLSAYYWQPIGIIYTRDGTISRRYFSGNYDGGGHTVSGVFTPAGLGYAYYCQGLFGYVYGRSSTQRASISNLGVIDSFIQGEDNIGGVVGHLDYATVTNAYNTGSVSGSSFVGGVVGSPYSNATVSNVYNTGIVSGNSWVGGVMGSAYSNATVSNVYNTGTVEGTGDRVGGVMGSANGTVSNVYNTGSVSGSSSVGGVVGYVSSRSTVRNVYNTGSVSGTGDYVGGVMGGAGYNATVSNVYNTGSVSGSSTVGGVVGNADATVRNVYNTGIVRGDSQVGGVVGYTYSSSTVTNAYYGGACTLPVGIGSGEGSATKIDSPVEEWAKNEEWYLNSSNWNRSYPWDFENVWTFEIKNAPSYISDFIYPYLQSLGTEIPEHEIIYWTDEVAQEALGVDFDNYTLTQDTSASTTTYLIQSETDLAFLSWTIYNDQVYGGEENKYTSGSNNYFYSDVYFKQTTNLDLSAYYWQPIGIGYTRDGTSASRYFSGNYDGGGYTVSGVFTPAGDDSGYHYQGLFGYIQGRSSTQRATIANVGVIDSFVQGSSEVGGVVGYAFSATVSNVYNTGSVSGSGNCVGGVVGYASFSRATVSNVYNTGSVSGNSWVGGVVGYANTGAGISNVYNTGSVSGSSHVGGVVGDAYSNATVRNAYNIGSVSGNSQVGGVAGIVSSTSTVRNTYYGGACTLPVGIGSGSGSAKKIDSLVEEWAQNKDWYLDSSNWDSSHPWDFETVWNISVVFNGGYPCFDAFWTDKLAQNQLGVDFDNYSFDIDEKNRSIYYINNEADLAYLSWVIENEASDKVHVIEGMISCYFSGITFVQTADLDLSDYYWLPIAQRFDGQTGGVMFAGSYDGNGYSISGLYTPAFPDDYQGEPYDSGYAYRGLFGTVVNLSLVVGSGSGNCILENITILDSVIKGYGNHGGLVARSMGVDISNCHVEADVYGASTNGGIVGELSSATLSNCTHVGLIHTTGTGSGGLVGNLSGSIIHCTHIGDIISEGYANGGIAGEASSGATIDSCFVQGNFSGTSYAFVGRTNGSNVISNSGFEGSLEVQGAFSGSNGTFQNCYIIAEGASNFTTGQGNYTITNCLGIFTVDGTTTKRRRGTDFSAFAWPNADSCPVPKSLSWIGQFWSGDITAEIMASSEWTS